MDEFCAFRCASPPAKLLLTLIAAAGPTSETDAALSLEGLEVVIL